MNTRVYVYEVAWFGVLCALGCSGATRPAAAGDEHGSGGATNTCPAGAERCACYGNHTCESGLECRSDLCVAGVTGGAQAAGGSSSATTQSVFDGGSGGIGGTSGSGGASTATLTTLLATGGALASGGSKAIGGAPSLGGSQNAGGNVAGSTSTTLTDGLAAITQSTWDQINSSPCVAWLASAEPIPSSIEFIVDTTGSMSDVAPSSSDSKSKWEILKAALSAALDALPASTSVGLLLWPNQMTVPNTHTEPYTAPGGVGACVNTDGAVPLGKLGAIGSSQRVTLQGVLDACRPQGGTPTADAYTYAIENTFGNAALMPGSKYAVLVTDGQPTIQLGCMGTGAEARPVDFAPVLGAVAGAHTNVNVRTAIVGLPGSEHQSPTGIDGRILLSEAAQAGGTPLSSACQDNGPDFCHFDLAFAPDLGIALRSTLQSIGDSALSCRYVVPSDALLGMKVEPNRLNVVYQVNGSQSVGDMKLIRRASDSTCPEGGGWFMDSADPNGRAIRLCPSTCRVIENDPAGSIALRGGCESVEP